MKRVLYIYIYEDFDFEPGIEDHMTVVKKKKKMII